MRSTSERQVLTVSAIAFASTVLLYAYVATSGAAQSTRSEPSLQGTTDVHTANGRIIKDEVPKHLPIKVKVKNADREKWLDELEVEVTNTSDKPMYYVRFVLMLTDVTINGAPIAFPMRYGRKELFEFETVLQPDDVSLKPGESHTFKLAVGNLRGFAMYEARNNLKQSGVKRARLLFQRINFGDGTGFQTTGGIPYPHPRAKQCKQEEKKERTKEIQS